MQRKLSKGRNPMSFIAFENVTKTYQMGEVSIHALDGVSFTIEQGDFVIIAGASGAGKSTILNLLGGMDHVSSGKITVGDKEISSFKDKEMTEYRRDDVGFVFQFYNLIQNLTVRENVELAAQISKNPKDIDETLAEVELSERMYNFPSQISGGEQQRVAIARAIAKNPGLLLCDEPTGALDYKTGKQVLKVLQDICRSEKTTVIVITHNLALTPIGNKVIKVRSGKIESVEVNPHPMDAQEIEY
jgi:putative ABC transport system ATP-binding protein